MPKVGMEPIRRAQVIQAVIQCIVEGGLETLTMDAVDTGHSACFVTANDLVSDLGRTTREARLDRRMRVYLGPKTLIVNEMGYLPLDELGATVFSQLVSAPLRAR